VTTYAYDPATGELTSIDYSDNTQDIAFTYDRLGRQKTITDAVGSRTFGYNNQLQQETETITGIYNKVITRTYETAGVPGRAIGFNLGAGYSVAYGYEAGTGRFRSVAWEVSGENDTATYSYVPNSDLLYQLTTTSGLATTYNYENDRNLKTQVKNEFNAQLISQYDYAYNNIGLREHADTSGSAFTGTPIETTPETSVYSTNSLNQYTQITKDNGQQSTDTLTYDDDGNLSSIVSGSTTKNYKYNAENRLISVEPATPTNGDKKVKFVYDYMGRRIQKKVYTYVSDLWSLSSDTLFFYDGCNMVQEQNATGVVQKSYVWGLDLSQSQEGAGGVGGLLSVVDSGEVYHFLYDSNGNVGQVVKASDGSIVAHYEYDPFGILLKSYGVMKDANPIRFSTKYYDIETDLYYYGYRYYSPNLGRWISRDPMGERSGLNIYAFVLNNSLNFIDYIGLWNLQGVLKLLCCDIDGQKAIKILAQYTVYSIEPQTGKTQYFIDNTYTIKAGAPVAWMKGGYHSRGSMEIAINDIYSNEQAAATIIHETTHAKQHDYMSSNPNAPPMTRAEKEREARFRGTTVKFQITFELHEGVRSLISSWLGGKGGTNSFILYWNKLRKRWW
jgi:RHS repeat-associated protein